MSRFRPKSFIYTGKGCSIIAQARIPITAEATATNGMDASTSKNTLSSALTSSNFFISTIISLSLIDIMDITI